MKAFYLDKSLGIDIRDEYVALTLLGRKIRGIDLMGWHYFRTFPERGQQATEQVFINEISNFLVRHDVQPETVVLGLPRRLITVQVFDLPAPNRKTLDSILEFELENHFSAKMAELNVTWHAKEQGPNLYRVVAAGIKKESVTYYSQLLAQLELAPTVIDVSSFANLNVILNNNGLSGKAEAVVDVTSNSVDVTIVKNGLVEISRHMPLRDPDFSKPYFDNEKPPVVFESLSQGFSGLIRDALLSTLYACTRLGPDEGIEKIHFFGGGNYLNALPRQIEQDTEVFTQATLPTFMMKEDLPVDFHPGFLMGSLALAQRGVHRNSFELNLRPLQESERKRRSSAYRRTVVFGALTILALAGLVGSDLWSKKRILDSLDLQLQEVKSQVGSLEIVDQEFDQLKAYIDALNRIERKYPLKLPLLQELSRRLPQDTWLTRINIADNQIEVQGFSSSASKLISILEGSRYFRNTTFKGSIVKEIRGERFSLQSDLENPEQ